MSLISVDAALAHCRKNVAALEVETVVLEDAAGRVLAEPLSARRTQPPFDASAMDGYAVRGGASKSTEPYRVIGQSAAGHGFDGEVGEGEAVRIFTGAPMPDGANAIIIQENIKRDGEQIRVIDGAPEARHVRRRGADFRKGDALIPADTVLGARSLTLAAAMGFGALPVRRKPLVALVATGDELVLPGEEVGRDQIVCSNPFGIATMLERNGAATKFTGIAADTVSDLARHLDEAADADLVLTIGGASVGDHDLVAPVLKDRGVALDFWKIAMRPGKPLMFGRSATQTFLGLPGNPVSSLICARVFAVAIVHAMLGLPADRQRATSAILTEPLEANGPRRHYMRAMLKMNGSGEREVTPVASQDSSLLATLFRADVLIVREAEAPPAAAGSSVPVIPLDF